MGQSWVRSKKTRLVGLLAVTLIASCGTRGSGANLQTKSDATLPATFLPSAVLSTASGGLLIGHDAGSSGGRIWHLSADGTAVAGAEAPNYDRVFAASAAKAHLAVGSRCREDVDREACPATLLESLVLRDDGSIEATHMLETFGPDGYSGFSYAGVADDKVWLITDAGVLGVGGSGSVAERVPIPTGPGKVCAAGSGLYQITGGPRGFDQQQPRTPGEPFAVEGIDPRAENDYSFQILRWDGQGWTNVAGASTEGSTVGVVDTRCTHDGFVVFAADPVATWSPAARWTPVKVATEPTEPATPNPRLTSLNNAYRLLSDGTVQRLDEQAHWVDTAMDLPAKRSGAPPSGFAIDDSEGVVTACEVLVHGPTDSAQSLECLVSKA